MAYYNLDKRIALFKIIIITMKILFLKSKSMLKLTWKITGADSLKTHKGSALPDIKKCYTDTRWKKTRHEYESRD